MAKNELNALTLGYAGAIVAAVCMLVLSILAKLGWYTSAAAQMQKWHMFYSVTVMGTITGMIEAAVISFVFLYLFGWVYNKFLK